VKLIRIVKLWTSLVTIEILVVLEGMLFWLQNEAAIRINLQEMFYTSLFLRRENLLENTSDQYGCKQNVKLLCKNNTFLSQVLLALHCCKQVKMQPCFIIYLRTVNYHFHVFRCPGRAK